MVANIFEFIWLLFEFLMNRYVFGYVVLPGIIVSGIIKYYKEQGNPVLRPVLKFLTIYYVLRTIVVIFL